ncbi:protein NUCLEOLAR COMPLEX ASSOCIATED 4 [Nymphaea colorata]|nr:protein NUCLEOLAR COMPLEX ASSOCIATED 4 [Nymphaea colorata]
MPSFPTISRPEYTAKDLKKLGHQLLTSRAHLNNAPILLSVLSPSPSPPPLDVALESILSLQSFFIPLVPTLPSSSSSLRDASSTLRSPAGGGGVGEAELAESIYRHWLKARFDEFFDLLSGLAVSPETDENLKDIALDAIMEFIRQGKSGAFQSDLLFRFLHKIVYSEYSVATLLSLFKSKYFNFVDVCYFLYIGTAKLSRGFNPAKVSGGKLDHVMYNIHDILSLIPSHMPPKAILKEEDKQFELDIWSPLGISSKETDSEQSEKVLAVKDGFRESKKVTDEASVTSILKKMKNRFSKAWMSFLRLPLPLDLYKKVLTDLHEAVIPNLANPLLLCDFLTRSYDAGGVVSVMALSSLFVLMTQHGLEYPRFYEKLYALLVPSLFLVKYRAKFFEFLDTCLKTPLFPAYLAAAFAKKLSRLALSAPPSGSLVIIAIIHNLLRRHPSINFLVHQHFDDEVDGNTSTEPKEFNEKGESDACVLKVGKKPGMDPFVNEESDPAKTNAMKSSLWEVDNLRHHYCPAVSRFVLSLENDLTVRAKTSEIEVKDFSSGSYGTIFKEEVGRRIKQVPLAFYKTTPTSLFSEADFAGWTFVIGQDGEKNQADPKRITDSSNISVDDTLSKRQRCE